MLSKSISVAVLLTVCTSAFGQTLIEKADKQYELHAYRLAAKSYEAILSNNDDQWGASLRLADCYLHLNDLEKATAQYARAVNDGQAQAEDYLRYGRVLMMLGQYVAAEQKFTVYRKANSSVANQFIKACEYARSNTESASSYEVAPLSKINTNAAEFGPSIWRDQLIWSSTRTDFKRGQANTLKNDLINGEPNQMFIAPIEGVSNQAFKIHFLKTDLRNTFNESNPSFTADGKMVAFMRNNIAEDERVTSNGGLEMSLFLADVDADGNWLNPRPFPHNSSSTGFPCFSPDGNTLYYASNRSGGYGGFDIYKSEKKGNFWGEPKNLGATINSQGDEITPFHDGKTLYFASDWHFGFGGYDIFKLEGSEVVNLGTGVNSSGDDYGFVYAPSVSVGFFVSNRKGVKGKDDVYRVKTNGESANIVILENGKPLNGAKVTVTQGNAANLSAFKGGNYNINLSDRKPLTIEVQKEGFKTKTVKIEPEYTNSSRLIEVKMERAVPTQMSTLPEYSAMITDGSSGEPLENVIVRIVNQNADEQSELRTDVKGKFKFPMTATSSYLLIFSKEGFVEFQKLVKASDTKTRFLGEFALKPSAVTNKTDITSTQPSSTKPSNTKPPVDKKTDVPGDYSIRVIPSSTKKEQEATQGEKKPVTTFYSVQFSVLKLTESIDANKYDGLKKEGNIYGVTENNVQKIRLGTYKTRDEAVNATKKVANMGYKDAFIVQETNEQFATDNLFVATPQPVKPAPVVNEPTDKIVAVIEQPVYIPVPPKSTGDIPPPYNVVVPPKTAKGSTATTQPKPVKETVEQPKPKKETAAPAPPKPKKEMPQPYSVALPSNKPPVVEDKTFKVRIASMKNADWFDDTKVSKLWKIEKVQEGNLTIFIMDGFKTLEEAKTMKKKVQASGYSDAKVVLRENKAFKVVD